MSETPIRLPLGQPVPMPGHFDVPVVIEGVRSLGSGYECRVRLPDGTLDEVVISAEEAESLAKLGGAPQTIRLVNPHDLALLVESAQIRLAYAPPPMRSLRK
jgi:hypothetical protein